GGRITREGALEVGGGGHRTAVTEVGPRDPEDVVAVGGQVGELGVGPVVLDVVVDLPREHGTGGTVDQSGAELGAAVDLAAGPAHDQPPGGGVHGLGRHVPVRSGVPGEQVAVGGVEGGHAAAGLAAHAGEVAAHVQRVAVDGQGLDPRVEAGGPTGKH